MFHTSVSRKHHRGTIPTPQYLLARILPFLGALTAIPSVPYESRFYGSMPFFRPCGNFYEVADGGRCGERKKEAGSFASRPRETALMLVGDLERESQTELNDARSGQAAGNRAKARRTLEVQERTAPVIVIEEVLRLHEELSVNAFGDAGVLGDAEIKLPNEGVPEVPVRTRSTINPQDERPERIEDADGIRSEQVCSVSSKVDVGVDGHALRIPAEGPGFAVVVRCRLGRVVAIAPAGVKLDGRGAVFSVTRSHLTPTIEVGAP